MQVQGQHPHQWTPFQTAGLLHAWQISHQISRYVYHEGWWPRASTLCNPSLSTVSMSSWAFHHPVCQRLSWLHHWSVPYVHTIGVFSEVLSFRMRSRSSMASCTSSSLDLVVTMSCGLTLQICLIIALSFCCRRWRFGFVNGQVSLAWIIVLCTQSCTQGHMFWKRGGVKKELVADPWTSSSGLCDWCRGCMQMHWAVSVLVRGTVKSLKWRLVFTKDQYSAHCSSSLCLKSYHESSALGSLGRTSMPMTLLSSLNHLRNVSGGSWLG